MIRIDTNYIIRYLVNDQVEMAEIAEKFISTQDIFISNEILAEVVYVLSGVYEIPRSDIANHLLELISFDNVSTSNYDVVKKALGIFGDENLDFVDCLLCSYSQKDEIATFDKKLNKCIQAIQPSQRQ